MAKPSIESFQSLLFILVYKSGVAVWQDTLHFCIKINYVFHTPLGLIPANILAVNKPCGTAFNWDESEHIYCCSAARQERSKPYNGLINSPRVSVPHTHTHASDYNCGQGQRGHSLEPWCIQTAVDPFLHFCSGRSVEKSMSFLLISKATYAHGAAPPAWSGRRINKLQQALHENNTDQFNIDAREWRA